MKLSIRDRNQTASKGVADKTGPEGFHPLQFGRRRFLNDGRCQQRALPFFDGMKEMLAKGGMVKRPCALWTEQHELKRGAFAELRFNPQLAA